MNYITRDYGHVVPVMIVIGFIKTGGYYSNITQVGNNYVIVIVFIKKVQVGKDQEKAQSEKDSHSKNRDGKKPN